MAAGELVQLVRVFVAPPEDESFIPTPTAVTHNYLQLQL